VILGWAVLFQTAALVLYVLIVGTCFHLFIVLYEERHLQKEFGGEYEDYRRRVSRWLPRLRRRQAASLSRSTCPPPACGLG
jgi:protein-S-isoprenylcysteine O-methyltransferase Ste14